MRKLLMMLLAVILLAAVGCGGGTELAGTIGADDAGVTDDALVTVDGGPFPGLPAIPADDPADAAYREVSALTYGEREIDVLDPYAKWRTWEANLYGTVPCLGLAGADHWEAEGGWGVTPLFAYALYKVTHVDRPDLDRHLTHLVLETSAYDNGSPDGMGDEYWLGLANFDTHMWEWLGPGNGIPEYEVDLAELTYDFTSELGNLYFIVVVMPENLVYLRNACVLYTEGEEEPVEPEYEICFAGLNDGMWGIYLTDEAGSFFNKIFESESTISGMSFSPDGNMIAFHMGATYQHYICVVNIDGSGFSQLVTAPLGAGHPTWQDNEFILYEYNDSEDEIYRIRYDGTGLEQISEDNGIDEKECWISPDGSQLAFTSKTAGTSGGYRKIYVADFPSMENKVLLADTGGNTRADVFPCWSAATNTIAFNSVTSQESLVYTVNVDGSELRQISIDGVKDWYPRFSPDGSRLVFQSIDASTGDYQIFMMDSSDGQNRQQLTSGFEIAQCPDWYVPREPAGGSRLIYAEDFSSDPDFELSDEVRLGDGDNPRWEDGVYKVYLKEYGPGANKYAMTPVFADLDDHSFSFQFDLRYVSSSWGMGMNIQLLPDDIEDKGDPPVYGLGMQLRDHHSWDNRGAIYVYDRHENRTGNTPRTDTSQWYTVYGEYDNAAGTFDFVMTEQGTDVVFYEEYDVSMSPETFNRIAFGASTKNWDGTDAEMHIDNIFVYEL
ncbi:PD40 domain-containing protein [bacterium]|nr:PD40 domain-containing protein [bacterium]